MLLGFQKVKRSNSPTELKMSTQLKSLNETAHSPESPLDVMTLLDRSHMTHQERYEFWQRSWLLLV